MIFELQKELYIYISLSNKVKIGFSDTKAKDEENLICARHGVTWMLRSRKMMSFCGRMSLFSVARVAVFVNRQQGIRLLIYDLGDFVHDPS